VSGTDWGRVDASEALLKGVKGIFSVKGYDMAGAEQSRGAAPPLNMDAFSFELYMQRRNLPPLEDTISHSRLEQERARLTAAAAPGLKEEKTTYIQALLDERYGVQRRLVAAAFVRVCSNICCGRFAPLTKRPSTAKLAGKFVNGLV
jgi:hypothetical protein